MNEKEKEKYKFLAQLMLKYCHMGTKEAFRELMKIDFIKNNYGKSTLYNYIGGTKALLLKNGKMNKGMSKYLAEAIAQVQKYNKAPQEIYIERIKEPVETCESLTKKLEDLNKKISILEKEYNFKKQELTETYTQAQRLIEEQMTQVKEQREQIIIKQAQKLIDRI